MVIRMRKLAIIIMIIVTVLIVGWMLLFPHHILRFFYPLHYKETVFENAMKYDIDPYLVMAVIKVESNFNPRAESHMGAKGLMQLTDQTAAWGADVLGIDDYRIEQAFEADVNILIGCWYLNNLIGEFDHNLQLVLAAYNGGSGNVTRWLQNEEYSQSGKRLDRIPFKETEQYVENVNREYDMYKKLYDSNGH